jgi:tyrosyl-tRNA synthetase
MGKTHKGTVWLDSRLTSPYEYYQYWINQDDRDIERFLGFFTYLPMDEVRRLGSLQGEEVRTAKEVLAYEATALCHGKGAAEKARAASRQLFGQAVSSYSDSVPTLVIRSEELEQGIPAYLLFEKGRLCKTRGEARRLISQGGAYINDHRIETFDQMIDFHHLKQGSMVLRAGKKKYLRVVAGPSD